MTVRFKLRLVIAALGCATIAGCATTDRGLGSGGLSAGVAELRAYGADAGPIAAVEAPEASADLAAAARQTRPATLDAVAGPELQAMIAEADAAAAQRPPADLFARAASLKTAAGKLRRDGPFIPQRRLSPCLWMSVTNQPALNDAGAIDTYAPVVEPRPGLYLATVPLNGACLTSGFGMRWGRMHKGVDLFAPINAPIVAAGPGRVIEARYYKNYGNMLLLDHGGGVYTRYAHLAGFAPAARVGAWVGYGERIGWMGATSDRAVGRHLHYEILTGDAEGRPGAFGLAALDPFTLKPAGG